MSNQQLDPKSAAAAQSEPKKPRDPKGDVKRDDSRSRPQEKRPEQKTNADPVLALASRHRAVLPDRLALCRHPNAERAYRNQL